jgi:hypothetical protein
MAPHDLSGYPELYANVANFVLKERSQRFDKCKVQVIWQASDVVVTLDIRGARSSTGLHNIGI